MEQIKFKQHRRTNLAELVEWNLVKTEIDLEKVSISEVDRELANENLEEFDKGFLARNPNNHNDMWYVSKKYYDENFEALPENDNHSDFFTSKIDDKRVKSLVIWGDKDVINFDNSNKLHFSIVISDNNNNDIKVITFVPKKEVRKKLSKTGIIGVQLENQVDSNFEELSPQNELEVEMEKTLHNTTASQAAENVKDIVFWGNGNTFKLIAKASSKQEKWMKSTKAMEITGIGCVIQVTTQQGDNVAEALTFVPNTRIKDIKDEDGNVVSRQIVQ